MGMFTSVVDRGVDISSFDPYINELSDGMHLLRYSNQSEQIVDIFRFQGPDYGNIVLQRVFPVPDKILLGEIQQIAQEYFLILTRVHFTWEDIRDVSDRYDNLITAYNDNMFHRVDES